MSAIRALLRGSIDYAGLFPPAGLDMTSAVKNYDQYRKGPNAWALGRFVVPVNRLGEFESAARSQMPSGRAEPWPLAVLIGANLSADLHHLEQTNRGREKTAASAGTANVIEVKASSEGEVEEIMRRLRPGLQAYIEVPIDRNPADLIAMIGRLGGRAKVRTGGVTSDTFPSAADLCRFIRECVVAHVPFKATAGLHHPLRAEYPLTYAPDSPRETMFGFLNLFLAVALLREGMNGPDVMRLLEERSPDTIQADEHEITWRGHRVGLKALSDARRDGIISFGSCSFTEPIGDLEALHLLQPRAQRA